MGLQTLPNGSLHIKLTPVENQCFRSRDSPCKIIKAGPGITGGEIMMQYWWAEVCPASVSFQGMYVSPSPVKLGAKITSKYIDRPLS